MSEITKPIVLDETAQAIKDEIHSIAVGLGANGVVRYDEAQTLTDSEKATARANIKAVKEPISEGTSGQVLTTDGQGNRSWTTVQSGGAVTSVNGKTGAVVLSANDVGAETSGAVSGHNSDSTAHSTLFAAKADASHTTDANAHSTLFSAKADSVHTHTTADIIDMPTAFDSVIVGGNTYVLRMGTTGAAGYITFVAEA